MAPKRTWLQEERRRTLGDWVALCPSCGHAQRYFEQTEGTLPARCPTCDAALVVRCPTCEARIPSVFAVDCEECGAPLRSPTGFGVPIRRARARSATQWTAQPAAEAHRRGSGDPSTR